MESARAAVVCLMALLCVAGRTSAAKAAEKSDAGGRKVAVSTDVGLRRALADAQPGVRIALAAGKYQPGVWAKGLRGTAEAPIVIEAADPKDPPVFEGGSLGLQLSACEHVTVRNLVIRGQSGNGVNIDDGGDFDEPSNHITLEGLRVSEIGPRGNCDGIKLSGLDDLIVRGCDIQGWGGEGIDLVGCHRGLIEGCTFRGKAGFSQTTGIQAKGGSADITVRGCSFVNPGERGVNLGGSTALSVFRPRDATFEAKNITVEGCHFVGGISPIAFVGVDGATVRYNTIYRPEKWVARILQETVAERFVPSRKGRFERNLIVFRQDQARFAVNVGPNTEPQSFTFKENLWHCEDRPGTRPQLPNAEQGGVYDIDPRMSLKSEGSPGAPAAVSAKVFGADALPTIESKGKGPTRE